MSTLLVTGSLFSSHIKADDGQTPSTNPGVATITEGKVTATISFLASDELGGRGTGTGGFNVAAAYVASRFRGAGLVPVANESYYHETIVKQVRLPASAKLTDGVGKPLTNWGPLAAGAEAFVYDGPIQSVDLSSLKEGDKLSGMVIGKYEPETRGNRGLGQLARLASQLRDAGATALLLVTTEDSDWTSQATSLRDNARPESSVRNSIPIILVAAEVADVTQIHLDVSANIINESPMRNVIGVLPGSDPELSKQAILFSAHLDHLGANPNVGDGIFNGADDDASGCTAVITLADAFGALPEHPKRSLLFMTFWGEEMGLLGSKEFAAKPSWPLDKIVANVNIEMIGRPEPGARGKIWATGWNESNLGSLMGAAAIGSGGEIFEHPKFSAMLYRSSDNWSFVQKGVIAHSFSAGSLHEDYHKPDDEWDRLEIPHMTSVIRTLFISSLPLANGEVTPTKSK